MASLGGLEDDSSIENRGLQRCLTAKSAYIWKLPMNNAAQPIFLQNSSLLLPHVPAEGHPRSGVFIVPVNTNSLMGMAYWEARHMPHSYCPLLLQNFRCPGVAYVRWNPTELRANNHPHPHSHPHPYPHLHPTLSKNRCSLGTKIEKHCPPNPF